MQREIDHQVMMEIQELVAEGEVDHLVIHELFVLETHLYIALLQHRIGD